jgi:hypothetical protein
MKTRTLSSGAFSAICAAPCQSMSKITSWPASSAAITGALGVP